MLNKEVNKVEKMFLIDWKFCLCFRTGGNNRQASFICVGVVLSVRSINICCASCCYKTVSYWFFEFVLHKYSIMKQVHQVSDTLVQSWFGTRPFGHLSLLHHCCSKTFDNSVKISAGKHVQIKNSCCSMVIEDVEVTPISLWHPPCWKTILQLYSKKEFVPFFWHNIDKVEIASISIMQSSQTKSFRILKNLATWFKSTLAIWYSFLHL